jgi:hypothetical protein
MNSLRVFFTCCLLVVSLSGCLKKRLVVNKLEGTWTYTKYLHKNGTYDYYGNQTLVFEKGKADGKTYLGLTVKTDNVVTAGTYLVDKKGAQIYLMYDSNFPTHVDTLTIEDMDKNSLIVRDEAGIRFYDKIAD